MAFKKLGPAPSLRHSPLRARLREDPQRKGRTQIDLSRASMDALGHPTAVHFEWDDEMYRLRVVASSPDDPAARTLGRNGRLSVAAVFKMLGLEVSEPVSLHVTRDGPLAIILDLSPLRYGADA